MLSLALRMIFVQCPIKKKTNLGSWRDGSVFETANCCHRRPGFSSQCAHQVAHSLLSFQLQEPSGLLVQPYACSAHQLMQAHARIHII